MREGAIESVESAPQLYQRIVLATDGSSHAQVAASLLADLQWPAGTIIAVVGVCTETPPPPSESPQTGVEQDARRYLAMRHEDEMARVTGIVAQTAAMLRERHPNVTFEEIVLDGEPAARLLALAGEWQADLVVAGARGQTVLHGLLLGSVSEALVAEARCPVLIARRTPGPLDRVLVAASQESDAARLAEACLALPLPDGVRVIAASVGRSASDDLAQQTAEELAHRLRAGSPTLTVESRPLTGDVASALTAAVSEQAIDLVIVGSRERRGLAARVGLGSVSRKLVRRAVSAVLVTRDAAGQE